MRWPKTNTQAFAVPSAKKTIRRLRVEQRGLSDGQNEQPESNEKTLHGTQFEIVHHHKQLFRQANQVATRQWNAARDLGHEIDIPDIHTRLSQIPEQCAGVIRDIESRHQATVELLEDRESREGEHYEHFREKNGLRRIASYPKTRLPIAGLVLLLFTVNILAVYWFFREIPGVMGLALWQKVGVVAALNMLLPLLFANGFRNVNHIQSSRRVTGRFALFLSVVSIMALGLLAIAYLSGQSASEFVSQFKANASLFRFPVLSLHQWALFGLVNSVGLFAFLIGYKSDDPYPEYGQVQRSFHKCVKERRAFSKRLANQISATVARFEQQVAKEISSLKRSILNYAKLVDRYDASIKYMPVYKATLEDACNIVLARYRTINQGARETDVPESFENWFCFGPSEEAEIQSSELEKARLLKFQSALTELETQQAGLHSQLIALKEVSEHATAAKPEASVKSAVMR